MKKKKLLVGVFQKFINIIEINQVHDFTKNRFFYSFFDIFSNVDKNFILGTLIDNCSDLGSFELF